MTYDTFFSILLLFFFGPATAIVGIGVFIYVADKINEYFRKD